jgi:hypothetical protein
LISAPGYGSGGKTYLILGKASGWAINTSLSAASASFVGNAGDASGISVSGAGDVNGDGYDDILIGAENYSDATGKTYLILGKASGWAVDTSLSSASASFIGEDQYDKSGHSVSNAGDVNRDGYGDILIGAYAYGNGAGKTYLILGKASGWAMDTPLSSADESFVGENGGFGEEVPDNSGESVSGAGDVNGDGYADILIGAGGYGGDYTGQAYLILGGSSGWGTDINLSSASASFIGEHPGDIGISGLDMPVSGAGDVNGDGYDDILIGTPGYLSGNHIGQTYLILGKASGWAMDTSLSSASASFIGENTADYSGYSVSGAGDVNGDGYADILIGAENNDEGGDNAGKTYLILSSPLQFDFIQARHLQAGESLTAGDISIRDHSIIANSPMYLDATKVSVLGGLDVSGNVGIGTTAPVAKLEVSKEYWDTDPGNTAAVLGRSFVNITSGTNAYDKVYGGSFGSLVNGESDYNSTAYGLSAGVIQGGAGTLAEAIAGDFGITAFGNITTAKGLNVVVNTDGGQIGTGYGLYIAGVEGVNARYGVYVNDAAAANYFAGNVGIGSTSPASKLQIVGSGTGANTSTLWTVNADGTTGLFVDDRGYVGIGTTNPTDDLYIYNPNGDVGFTIIDASSDPSALRFHLDGGKNYIQSGTGKVGGTSADLIIGNMYDTEHWMTFTGATGNVGIGTTAPNYRLDVTGIVNSFELQSDALIVRNNLVTNGEFEGTYVAGVAPGWTAINTPTSVSQETGHRGVSSQGAVARINGNGLFNQDITWTTGHRYQVSYWAKTDSASDTVQVYIGANGGFTFPQETVTTAWKKFSYTFTGSTTGAAQIQLMGMNATVKYYFDDVSVTDLDNNSYNLYSGLNNNVGIGMPSDASSKLQIVGSGTGADTSSLWTVNSAGDTGLFVNDQGYVGIGTTNPVRKLQVDQGDISNYTYSDTPGYIWGFVSDRSRGTPGSPTSVASGDSLGLFVASGYDGGAYKDASAIRMTVDGTVSSGTVPGRLEFVTADSVGTPLERMRINSSGNVGIGTTDPQFALQFATNAGYLNYWDPTGSVAIKASGDIWGKKFVDYEDSQYYLDPANAGTSLTVAGNVGIGTTAPDAKLSIVRTPGNDGLKITTSGTETYTGWLLNIDNSEAANLLMVGTSDNGLMAAGNSNLIFGEVENGTTGVTVDGKAATSRFYGRSSDNIPLAILGKPTQTAPYFTVSSSGPFTGDTTADIFIIDSNGYIGIGTTSPTAPLSVGGASSILSNISGDITITPNQNLILSQGNLGIGTTDPGYTLTVVGTSWTTNNAWSGSDLRLKQNIQPISDALNKVLQLGGVSYQWKTSEFPQSSFDDKIHLGLIAQDVEKIVPELVTMGPDGYKGLDYNGFAPLLIGAVQEQQSQLTSLSGQLSSLSSAVQIDLVGIGTTNPADIISDTSPESINMLSIDGSIQINQSMITDAASNNLYNNSGVLFWNNKQISAGPDLYSISGTVPDGDSLLIEHNQGTNDILVTAWTNIGTKWVKISDLGDSSDTTSGYYFSQPDNNAVRLYNKSGTLQSLKLDVFVSGANVAEWYTPEIVVADTSPSIPSDTSPSIPSDTSPSIPADTSPSAPSDTSPAPIVTGTTTSTEIEAGDIVAISATLDDYNMPMVRKTNAYYDSGLFGVVTLKATSEMGIQRDGRKLVALSGRVLVKIDPASSDIKPGDFITASSLEGYATKAEMPGRVVGTALQSWSKDSTDKKILISLNPTYNSPALQIDTSTLTSGSILTEMLALRDQIIALTTNLKDTISSLGMTLSKDETTGKDVLAVNSDMHILGDVTMANLSVSGNIQAGTISIDTIDNSVNVLGVACFNAEMGTLDETLCSDQTLFIQKNSSGNVDMFSGKIVAKPDGTLIVENSIETKKLVINTADVASASAGKATIKAGDTSITINTSAVNDKSIIMVTPERPVTIGGKYKEDGKFEIFLKDAESEDLNINWIIVGRKN